MPEFGSPFSGLASSKKLTDKELIRAIRFMAAAGCEAIQMPMQLGEEGEEVEKKIRKTKQNIFGSSPDRVGKRGNFSVFFPSFRRKPESTQVSSV